jgi:hypothetical protein
MLKMDEAELNAELKKYGIELTNPASATLRCKKCGSTFPFIKNSDIFYACPKQCNWTTEIAKKIKELNKRLPSPTKAIDCRETGHSDSFVPLDHPSLKVGKPLWAIKTRNAEGVKKFTGVIIYDSLQGKHWQEIFCPSCKDYKSRTEIPSAEVDEMKRRGELTDYKPRVANERKI